MSDDEIEFEEYKQKIDQLFEEKKRQTEKQFSSVIHQTTEEIENEIYQLEAEYKKAHKDLEIEYEIKRKKVIEELEREYHTKEEDEKLKIKETVKSNNSILSKQKDIQNLEVEIFGIQEEINKYKNDKNSQDFSSQYNEEVKQLEQNFEIQLSNYQTFLENELNNKKQLIRNNLLNKKLEYETSLKKQDNTRVSDGSILKEKKELIYKNHQLKLNQYKDSLVNFYQNQVDSEKEKVIIESGYTVSKLKEEYDNMKKLYECQEVLYSSEQLVMNNSSLIDKLQSIFMNKNSIIKNIIEFSYYFLRKKLIEYEQNPLFSDLLSKDDIMNKLTEVLSYIVYDVIYEFLLEDITLDKDMIDKSLEEINTMLEKVISCFPFQNKIQLNMLIANPKFN